MKKWFGWMQLVPALAVALAAGIGFQLSTPVFEAIVWPEKPAAVEPEKTEEETVEAEPLVQKTGTYEDGTYYGAGTGYSGITHVEVIVEDSQITQINIVDYQDDNSFFNRAKGVITQILSQQSWEVDAISGATYSSRGILEAVKNALTGEASLSEPAADSQAKPTALSVSKFDDSAEWADGTYTGTGKGFGGTIKASVTIKEGKITSIQVLSHSGETDSYYSKAKKIISRILKAQSPNVDTVSGATYSSNGIREAVKSALNKAAGKSSEKSDKDKEKSEKKKTKKDKVTLPEGAPANGSFTGRGACEDFGYSVTLDAVFQDGSLKNLKNFTMVDNEDEANEPFCEKAWKGMKANLLADPSGDVDMVSGATYSSEAILAAYQDAYRQAVKANGGSVETPDESDNPEENQPSEPDEPDDPEEEQPSEPENPGDSSEDNPGDDGPGNGGEDDDTNEGEILKNGTYTGSALCEPDENEEFAAYTLMADVTFENDTLISINHITATDTSNKNYYNRAAEGTSKKPGVVNQLIEKQSSENIDAVSGATCSSKALVAIYEDAWNQAKKAKEKG